MDYGLLADAVVVIHFLFIIYGLLGGLLYFWRAWLLLLHIPAAVWIVIVEVNHWICPLTPLENRFRHMAGETGYQSDFIQQYIMPIIYPPGLTPEIQFMLGLGALAFNAIIYVIILRHYLIHLHIK